MKLANKPESKTRTTSRAATTAPKSTVATTTRQVQTDNAVAKVAINGKTKPTSDQVREAAYYKYLNAGCASGRDLQHWLEAESQLGCH